MSYVNPIISGFHPDPSVCRLGDDYYLVTSSFEYYPGVPLFHSRDLVNWEQIGHVLNRPSQLQLEGARSSGGVYAPTIRVHNGIFYMTTTNVSGLGNFFVYTDDPRGSWSDPIRVDQPGIDPDLFFDEDGSVYYSTAQGLDGIFQSRIDLKTGARLSEVKPIWRGTGGQYPEAPHLYRIGDWYYLMIAEGGTEFGHMVTIGRSRQPDGPFESNPDNPILTHRSRASSIQSTGHADLIELADGSWWAVCLGVRPVGYPNKHHLGRETFLAPVSWNEAGWPVVGDEGMIQETMPSDGLQLQPLQELPVRDDFTGDKLASYWNFLRSPLLENGAAVLEAGRLVLTGNAETLDDAGGSPVFVGRRQQHFRSRFSIKLNFQAEQEGDEAGVTTYMNERFHYELALTHRDGVRKLIFRRRIGSLQVVERELPWPDEVVVLVIEADKEHYRFGYVDGDRDAEWLGQGECALLSTEVAGGFTGVFFAMYVTGNGKDASKPAYVDWAEYESLE